MIVIGGAQVDDLEQIGLLEQYIAQTQVMIIILSKNYFLSKNCMREVRATCTGRKPVVLVHEADLQRAVRNSKSWWTNVQPMPGSTSLVRRAHAGL